MQLVKKMAFWCRIKQSKLKHFSHQFKNCYLQIPYHYSSLNYTTTSSPVRAFVLGKNPVSVSLKRPTEFCNNARFFAAPVQAKPKKEEKDKGPRLNDKITAKFVRVVSPDGDRHFVCSRNEALEQARKLKVDLVEVQRDSDPPVCKLMDFHKEKYMLQLKEKERTKSKATVKKGDCKEVRFTGKTEQKDLQMKADTIKRLMERGYRVKCMATGTEDQDLGRFLSRISVLIEDVAVVESGPIVEKKQAYVIVRHVKFGPPKKGAKKASKVVGSTDSEAQKVSTEDDLAPAGSSLGKNENTWSVSDKVDDFDNLFDVSVVKGSTSRSIEEEEMATRPKAASTPANIRFPETLRPKPVLDSARANTTPSPSSLKHPLESNNRFTRNEPRTQIPPTRERGNNATDSSKLPQSDVNISPTRPSFGAFSAPKSSAGNLGVAGELQRNKEINSPPKQQEQSRPGPPNSPSPGYGIFSSGKANAPPKQGVTEINRNKKGSTFDS